MKHLLKSAAFCGTVLAGAAFAQDSNPLDWRSIPEKNDQITMLVGHSVNMEWSSHTATLKRFVELVGIYSDNEIKGEIFPGAQLGGEREMMQQARQGALHVTLPATNNAAALAPSLNVFILPYLATSTAQVNYLQDELTPFLVDRVIEERAFASSAGRTLAGGRSSTSRDEPIEKPEDLAGLKMRVPPNPIMIASYEAWGETRLRLPGPSFIPPCNRAWSKAATTRHRCDRDAVPRGHQPYDPFPLYHSDPSDHGVGTLVPGPVGRAQDAILRAGDEATAYIRWWQPLDEANWWEQAEEAGVIITDIEDEQPWIDAARAIWPNFYDELGPDGEEIVNRALEILAAYPGEE